MSTVYPAETADIHPATFVTLRFSLDRMGHVKDAESRRTHVKAERLKETTRAIGNTLTRAALHDAGAVETARSALCVRYAAADGEPFIGQECPPPQEPPATKRRWRFTRLAKSVAHAKQVSRLAVSKESRAHQSHVFADELFKIRVAGEAQRAGDEHLCVLTRDRMRNEERALAERTQALAARRLARRERGARVRVGVPAVVGRAQLGTRWSEYVACVALSRAGGHVLVYDDGSVCMRQPIPERLERVLQPYLEDSAQIVDEPVASDSSLRRRPVFVALSPDADRALEYFFVSFDDGSAECEGPPSLTTALLNRHHPDGTRTTRDTTHGSPNDEWRPRVTRLTFAPHDGWFVAWDDGRWAWCKLPRGLRAHLSACAAPTDAAHARLGDDDVTLPLDSAATGWDSTSGYEPPAEPDPPVPLVRELSISSTLGWFLLFSDGRWELAGSVPDGAEDFVDGMQRNGAEVRQITFGADDAWLGRYIDERGHCE